MVYSYHTSTRHLVGSLHKNNSVMKWQGWKTFEGLHLMVSMFLGYFYLAGCTLSIKYWQTDSDWVFSNYFKCTLTVDSLFAVTQGARILFGKLSYHWRPCGSGVRVQDFGSEACRFESFKFLQAAKYWKWVHLE